MRLAAAVHFALLAACASDAASSRLDGGDVPAPATSDAALVCATGIAQEHDFELAALQVYRWVLPAQGGSFTLERGAISLFASSPEIALDYAGEAREPVQAPERTQVTAEIERTTRGALRVTWQGARLEASETLAGMYEGALTLGEEQRAVACWRKDFAPPYRYDAEDGACRNGHGEAGRHRVPLQYVRETGNGECNDFASDALAETLDWPVFAGWNLRGADLSRASMHFALMPDADLAGASLAGFSFGYASINGIGDDHTVLPLDGVRHDASDDLHLGDAGSRRSEQPPYYAWRFACSERPLAAHCEDVVDGADSP